MFIGRAGKYLNFSHLKKLIVILLFLVSLSAQASHNRSGEITYKRIAPFTATVGGMTVPFFRYQITLILYTDDDTRSNSTGNVADRCSDSISFGDNTIELVNRANGGSPLCPTCAPCGCPNCGELIINEAGFRVKKNVYIVEHVYPGPGSYVIRVFDPNRNKDVVNIEASDQQPFYVESLLIINGFTGANSSPEFKYSPIDRGCTGTCFFHNPGAFDADGDSLSYAITTSRGDGGLTIPGYSFPDPGPGGTFGIDPVTGLLSWCSPQKQGEYNIAFIVSEWRRNTAGKYELIGTVLRDMQILVKTCINNRPPVVTVPPDTCVEAGALIFQRIRVSDPDSGDVVKLEAQSGAFASALPLASLSNTTGVMSPTNNFGYNSDFVWQTTCSQIRLQPYYTTFKVQDDADPKQVFFRTYAIRVVPPAVKNVTAVPQGSAIRLSWDLSVCNSTVNPLYRYRIYRHKGCTPIAFKPCQTGPPPATENYSLVANIGPQNNAFTDSDGGRGLVVGQNYSYLVLAIYSDSSSSFAGTQVCTELKKDVPLITHVDVLSTSAATGSLQVKWKRPFVTPGNLDTSIFKGPYKIALMHRAENETVFQEVYTASNTVVSALPESFTHAAIPTNSVSHTYFLRFYSDTTFIGNSRQASSVFLSATTSDRRINLSWRYDTPWDNKFYRIFRRDSGATAYIVVGTSTTNAYADQVNVQNAKPYQYYVESQGEYSAPFLPKPLINNSQELIVRAADKTAPISPTIAIEADCASGNVTVSWTDIKLFSDDVASYHLFYKPSINEPWMPVTVIKQGELLEFKTDGLTSIAGCYAVNATDINGNSGDNSPDFCIDNCPEFELPNVFSPNADGINDHFMAIKVRQVKEINLVVTDRWGNLAFKTTDPAFKWNGVSQISKEPASEGTFFYVCEVFEWRISGISKRTLKGTLQLVR
jgi:gliding motility-associated-like protein